MGFPTGDRFKRSADALEHLAAQGPRSVGVVYTDPHGLWNKTTQPFLDKKRALQLNAWGKHLSKEVEDVVKTLAEWVDKVAPEATTTYSTLWMTQRHLVRNTMKIFLAQSFSMEFASL
ncbi:hypothetical protein BUE80_DR004133 [Diplocarpon rosae]|nr:hypothetical protein BUE80_DR004133 [Diplocarpon rosae]